MNKSETKYLNTTRLMDGALLSLLMKKKYEFVTVKELRKKAGVNRATFYLHFEGMSDLLVESAMKKLWERFYGDIKVDVADSPVEDIRIISPRYFVP